MVPLGRMSKWWPRINNFGEWFFLLLIPTQLGKHFWVEWSFVHGIRNDYLVPIIYLADLVWIGWMAGRGREVVAGLGKWRKYWWIGLLIVANILVADNKGAAGYQWLRWGQWLITVVVISNYRSTILEKLKIVIPIWILTESWLGLAQVVNQGSLQGIFYWLGERRFTLATMGIAQMGWDGETILRAYGTFSHPNSLAGFLLVAVISWWKWRGKAPRDWRFWLVMWSGLMGILLSGSRTVWLMTVVIMTDYLIRQKIKKEAWWGYVMMAVLGGLLIVGVIRSDYQLSRFTGGWDKLSWVKRTRLNQTAFKMIKDYPLLGVGLGNFVVKLPDYQTGGNGQPVHNLGLWWWSQTGIAGMIIWGWGLIKLGSKKMIKGDRWLVMVLITVIVTGAVDHYWVTLPQNRWLIAAVIGMALNRVKLKHV